MFLLQLKKFNPSTPSKNTKVECGKCHEGKVLTGRMDDLQLWESGRAPGKGGHTKCELKDWTGTDARDTGLQAQGAA